MEDFIQVSRALFLASRFNLLIQLLIVYGLIDASVDSDRFRELRVPHTCEQVCKARFRCLFIME